MAAGGSRTRRLSCAGGAITVTLFLALFQESLLLAASAPEQHEVSLQCGEGWTQEGSKCFRVFERDASWKYAEKNCRSHGSTLARPESAAENALIGRLLGQVSPDTKKEFWIGMEARMKSALRESNVEFSWSDGASVSRYVGFWQIGQPRMEDGECVRVLGSPTEWRLSPCTLMLPFVCERPACVQGSFCCLSGGCVAEFQRCDGKKDCEDMSDELSCNPESIPPSTCMQLQKGESGKVLSPGHPSGYSPSLNCLWAIHAPLNSRIEISFDSFDTEPVTDVLTILDGGDTNSSVLLAVVSGKPKVESMRFTSSSNIVILRFRSDSAVEMRGFSASWKAMPYTCSSSLLALPYGQPLLPPDAPGFTPAGTECSWLITSGPSQLITLSFEALNLTGDAFLEIHDGSSPQFPLLSRFDASNASNTSSVVLSGLQNLISTQPSVLIYFRADTAHSSQPFRLTYKRGCDVVIRSSHGSLLSPGAGRLRYPPSVECTYTIELPEANPDHALSIVVNSFDLTASDHLEIFEGTAKGASLHEGDGFTFSVKPPHQLTIHQSRAFLRFRSTGFRRGVAMGFNLTYSANCESLPKSGSVTFSTRSTAFGTKVSISCSRGFEFTSGRGMTMTTECKEGGVWSETIVPECQPVYCSPVPQITNGYALSATNTSYGGMARYSCYEGFSFPSGKRVEEAKCGENGQWSALPFCKASSCPKLPTFMHGERKLEFGDGISYGSVYRYDCAPGFRRSGAATLLCQNNGKWSFEPPICSRTECPLLPRVSNGRLLVQRPFLFEQTAKVICNDGFVPSFEAQVRCLSNQTISAIPMCVDVNECKQESSQCDSTSTLCVNEPGGYSCRCLPGFLPILECSSPSVLPTSRVAVSSQAPVTLSSASSWCATDDDDERLIRLHFAVPRVIEKLHFEKENGGIPTEVSLSFSSVAGMPLHPYAEGNRTLFPLKSVASSTGFFLVLAHPVEALVIEIELVSYIEKPCMKVEVVGCQRFACQDINECEDENGHCEQICINTLGSFKCACKDGFDLFASDGQGGVSIKEGETGRDAKDVYRLNQSCVPRLCPPLQSPAHGLLLSTSTRFNFPMMVHFQCDFGYQLVGSDQLHCGADGNWNGTAPSCIPAICEGVRNQTEIGLFASPADTPIPFGKNISITCSQQNRPSPLSPFGGSRECIFDPKAGNPKMSYRLSGPPIDCPLTSCGAPPALAGVVYEGDIADPKVGAQLVFACRPPYALVGKSSYDDQFIRCMVDGVWDLGDLRCEGPVCVDPGFPDDGKVELSSVEEGAVAKFSCNRHGFRPFPMGAISCRLGMPCLISEDVGISTGYITDGAFADNSDETNYGYEPHKARLSSSGWCGSKDAFIFLSVDLQRIHTLTTLRLSGVAGHAGIRGHVTKLQLFYKTQFSLNYDTYPVEFETPSGNHNALHQFELDPPLRARYILLGVSEYEENPCMRFDLLGCLAPLNPAHERPNHLKVGWNSSVPECIDFEPPAFVDCPAEQITVQRDEQGQLMPAAYKVPKAVDNSGRIAWVRVEPPNFVPPRFIAVDTDVLYTAFDAAGNTAECVVKLRIPDTQPPLLKCPDSHSVSNGGDGPVEVHFNSTTVVLSLQDVSNVTDVVFSPTHAALRLGESVIVQVSATDAHGNKNTCQFEVANIPAPCSAASLYSSNTTIKSCSKKADGRMECTLTCKPKHTFAYLTQAVTSFSCSNGRWSPSGQAPACVPMAEEPARYELNVRMEYPLEGKIPPACLAAYTDTVATHFDALDTILSTRCSSSVQVFVRFLDVKFLDEHDKLAANYTVQILPTVLQNVFYDLCGLTLRTIFDLRIPGATTPVKELLNIAAAQLPPSAIAAGCPSLMAIRSEIGQGFGCSAGEVLRSSEEKAALPECLPCPVGSVNVNNTCIPCPLGSYQNEKGQLACKACPENTFTLYEGSTDITNCLKTCGNGMYSPTGLVPCFSCPRHTFSSTPPEDGVKRCEPCPGGAYTEKVGATSFAECKQPCELGSYSTTGLQPCSPCPLNTFQHAIGQQRCISCPEDRTTSQNRSISSEDCKQLECTRSTCLNRGTCVIRQHKTVCECKPGFMGDKCEKTEPFCDSNPCLNGGRCESISGSFRCACGGGYSGRVCQFAQNECNGVQCPNGGVCHDQPGFGTTKCICRTGFAGQHCREIADACTSSGVNPCRNGGDCQPLQLGRYKCKCLPGWSGPACEINIDDCADRPCALNATCHDLINDFSCECPKGFSGKRCTIKEELCTATSCVHGLCVDRLTSQECLCERGWAGPTCEENIDDCESSPCQNGATCTDEVAGYLCTCTLGYHGSNCQHLVDHCGSDPCANNATCNNEGMSFSCECPLGYEGDNCEVNVDECKTAQCFPIGTQACVDGVDSYECVCKSGYEGKLCEQKIDQCATQPCLNNGTCVDTGASYHCECLRGWNGTRCEDETGSCSSNPCKNDAQCVNLSNGFFCLCPEGVSGADCSVVPNRCIGEPCRNGGVCQDLGSKMMCSCPPGRSGEGCQYVSIVCPPDACKNGGECVASTDGTKHSCVCAKGFTGASCETNIDECALPNVCPRSAECVDQIGEAVCVCPLNVTGVNCEKAIDVDYDLHFGSSNARATLRAPKPLTDLEGLTLAAWVKFDQRDTQGTIMSFYNSSSRNLPSNLQQLLLVTSESIKVNLNGAHDVIALWMPGQKLNDRRWNHFALTWSSSTGTISVMWNSVRVFSESGHAKGTTLNINGVLSLGASPVGFSSTSSSANSFLGRLTRVSLWTRSLDFEAEIPQLVGDCQGAPFCPSDFTVVTSERETNVSWQEPAFVIPSQKRPKAKSLIQTTTDLPRHIVGIRQNVRNGDLLPLGEHIVTYIATDDIGRAAHCTFKVHVIDDHCPELSEPANGEQRCELWGPHLKYKACSIRCKDGFGFSMPAASFYSCGADGEWRPKSSQGTARKSSSVSPMSKFRYPQCTKTIPATRMMSLRLDYPAHSPCTAAGRDALRAAVLKSLNEANDRYNFCNLKDSSGCVGARVDVECENAVGMKVMGIGEEILRRTKKDTNSIFGGGQEHVFRLIADLPVKREKVYDHQAGEYRSVLEILEEEILRKQALSLDQTLPNGRPNLQTLKLEDVFLCQTGSVVIKDLCVPCAPGSFFEGITQRCSYCDIGYYQPLAGKTSCRACPTGFTTSSLGSMDEEDCKVSCPAGHFLDLSLPSAMMKSSSSCSPCGFAAYQPDEGSFECIPCPAGQTTLSETASDVAECRDECPDGQELSSAGGCVPCPIGWFRQRGSHAKCIQCPPGTTTDKEGSTRREQCDTPKCTKGQFLVPESKQCQLCPRGAFQDEEQQPACKLCPPDHTTAAHGATAESQCYSTNQCVTGEDNCSWHAICIDLPDDLDHPNFECKCKPGYRGNGTHCYDACQNFCLNDGICKKNPIGYVECVCKENFSGERCELRFQPRGQKFTIITSAVIGLIFVLILIIGVIFMISFRTNRVIDSAEKSGLSGLSGMQAIVPSTTSRRNDDIGGNFMCAVPRDAPRPIGYYYEDDDEYDMKTMYIGGGHLPEDSTGSASMLHPDAARRRRLAQQHLYKPGGVGWGGAGSGGLHQDQRALEGSGGSSAAGTSTPPMPATRRQSKAQDESTQPLR